MTDRKRLGDEGEEAVLQYLIGKGMMLMERNWRHRHLELDLIMLDEDGVHIVEVKTRTAPMITGPLDSVTVRKRQFMKNAASAYVSSNGIDADIHFDVASVTVSSEGFSVEFVPDAFTQFD